MTVTPEQLAKAIDRTVETVVNWQTGKHKPPCYIDATIRAVSLGLQPVTNDAMYAHRLTELIGVPKETEWTWRYERRFPLAARLAVAAQARVHLTSWDRVILRNVLQAGTYYRVTGGWRARPVMGKRPPDMKHATPSRLIQRGYLVARDGRLTLTRKGRDVAYGER